MINSGELRCNTSLNGEKKTPKGFLNCRKKPNKYFYICLMFLSKFLTAFVACRVLKENLTSYALHLEVTELCEHSSWGGHSPPF